MPTSCVVTPSQEDNNPGIANPKLTGHDKPIATGDREIHHSAQSNGT